MAPRGRGRPTDEPSAFEDQYPWELHERALEHLGRLEVAEAREALGAMLPRLTTWAPEKVRPAGFLAFDLIGQFRSLMEPLSASNGEWRARRWKEARAFAASQSGPALAALLQAAVADSLYAHSRSPENPLVARARAFIEQNYACKLSLRHVAEFLNVSRNYLSGLFRKECGRTITEHIHQTRVKRAEALLVAGGRTISEVAYQVGYQNYRDFYRNFVKFEKSSPTRFRRNRSPQRPAPGAPAQA